MTTVDRWTGQEAKLLREALRLSVRGFAAWLGVEVRTVNKWEARQADITPRPHMQEVLDTALARASDEAKARFTAAIRATVPEPETTQSSESPQCQRSCHWGEVMLPVMVNGRLVFIPFDAGTMASGELSTLLGELTPTSSVGDAAFVLTSEEAQKLDISAGASFDIWQTVTALPLGVGKTELDLDRLYKLIPCLEADEPPPRRIGAADVEASVIPTPR